MAHGIVKHPPPPPRDPDGLADAVRSVANAVTPRAAMGGNDAVGGHVESLTEAVMGVTAALVQVAEGLHAIADAIRQRK